MHSFLPSPTHPIPVPRRRTHRLDPVALPVFDLPTELAGLRILHLSDAHVRRRCRRLHALADAIRGVHIDLLVLTGDLMHRPGDETAAHDALARFLDAAQPRFGAAGVHGNHDSDDLRQRADRLPVRWLDNRTLDHPDLPLTVLGVGCAVRECSAPRGDLLAALMHQPAAAEHTRHTGNGHSARSAPVPLVHRAPGEAPAPAAPIARPTSGEAPASAGATAAVLDRPAGDRLAARHTAAAHRAGTPAIAEPAPPVITVTAPPSAPEAAAPHRAARFRILLAHVPSWLIPAADLGLPLVLSGHTHGGQVRLPGRRTLLNATPGWPCRLSAGILQHRSTLAVVSRGLGESGLKHLRLFCPPHAPLITLQHAKEPPLPTNSPRCVRHW